MKLDLVRFHLMPMREIFGKHVDHLEPEEGLLKSSTLLGMKRVEDF